MGVQDALEFFEIPKGRHQTLENIRGKTFAVDASSWLHKIIAFTSLGSLPARLFRQLPPGNMEEVVHSWLRCAIDYLDQYNINVVFVFDGARNPVKSKEDNRRAKVIEENRAAFRSIIKDNRRALRDQIGKCMLRSMYVRADLIGHMKTFAESRGIKFVCAPFEADAQLVQLEINGVVDGVIAEDTDLIALGAKPPVCKIHPIHKSKKEDIGKCQIIERDSCSGASKWTEESLLLAAMLLGNDYFPRPVRRGFVTVKAIAARVQEGVTDVESELRQLYI